MGAFRSIKPWAPPRWLLAGLMIVASLCVAEEGSLATKPSSATTAPIYLPHYDEEAWSLVRGSIIDQDTSASETTYTIFCPVETGIACDLSLEFPFIIVGGPHTVKFHGTVTSTYIANVECDLNGTTAATCSGYSSYRSGYSNGPHTGPTELSWTSTLSGTDVQWGALTLAPTPTQTADPLGVTITEQLEETSVDLDFMPSPTNEGAGARLASPSLRLLSMAISSVIVAMFIL
jgi:hypothetical protein